jgi:hypothetical protein
MHEVGGTLTITGSTFSRDAANAFVTDAGPSGGHGGAIVNLGRATISTSTFSLNSATAAGGAIENFAGFGIVSASTFVNNSAIEGGAIDSEIDPSGGAYPYLKLHNSTFSANAATSGGAIFNHGGTLTIGGTILADSPSGYNCLNRDSGTLQDNGYNLSYNATDPTHDGGNICGTTSVGDLLNANPHLNGPAANGGPTQTMALQATSPAIDQIPGSSALCPPTDQRGAPRQDRGEATCDIGAYEYQDNTTLSGYPTLRSGAYNLTNASLANAYLVGANLAGASLINGTFTNANLTLATLAGANLTNGNFKGANFTNANLANANLTQANLKGANLTGATWNNTICPDGTNSSSDGGTCLGHL